MQKCYTKINIAHDVEMEPQQMREKWSYITEGNRRQQ